MIYSFEVSFCLHTCQSKTSPKNYSQIVCRQNANELLSIWLIGLLWHMHTLAVRCEVNVDDRVQLTHVVNLKAKQFSRCD